MGHVYTKKRKDGTVWSYNGGGWAYTRRLYTSRTLYLFVGIANMHGEA